MYGSAPDDLNKKGLGETGIPKLELEDEGAEGMHVCVCLGCPNQLQCYWLVSGVVFMSGYTLTCCQPFPLNWEVCPL